jgi:hypothetical protein
VNSPWTDDYPRLGSNGDKSFDASSRAASGIVSVIRRCFCSEPCQTVRSPRASPHLAARMCTLLRG